MSHSSKQIDDLLQSLGIAREQPAQTATAPPPAAPAPEREPEPAGPAARPDPDDLARRQLEAAARRRSEAAAPPPETVEQPAPAAARRQPRERPVSTINYFPAAPESLDQAGLTDADVSALVLKFLYFRRAETGFKMSRHLGLRLAVIEPLLRQLKQDRMVVYKGTSTGGDYIYELTDLGMDRAAGLAGQCSYFGTAPVPLEQYIKAVAAQSLTHLQPSLERIGEAFGDMTMSDELVSRVGQAIHSGRGMFLYGNAGNGKTSMAERITKAFGDNIWIPRTLSLSGEIVRLFDPNKHQEVEIDSSTANAVDGRWVKVVRPTIMAGGELRMENLEIAYVRGSGIGEAPLQLKANCGTLLIDDFGRQKMSVDELLNRWIVPLEQRRDFIYLESGRTIEVPFDELIVFSTNLEPRDLVDEAFLRRIPYKIEVGDPSDEQFRSLFISLAKSMQLECKPALVEYLMETHFHGAGRGMRFCHPRDLLRQIENFCTLHKTPRVVTKDGLDRAVLNYFSIM